MARNSKKKSKLNDLNNINNSNIPVPADEGSVADRRIIPKRRDTHDKPSKKQKQAVLSSGLERRRGPGRRRRDHIRSAEEGEMSTEQFLFIMAIDAFKRVNNKTFPTWTDVLEIVRRLGYRKVQNSQINLPNTEDWLERADTPALVEQYSGIVDNDEYEESSCGFGKAYDNLDAMRDPDDLAAIDDLDELDQLTDDEEKYEDAA